MVYTPTPDDRNSIVITKQFTYRGATRTFSNRYHFEGDLPADAAAWTLLADAIVTSEKTIYDDTVTIIEAVGYDQASATLTNLHGDAVFTKTYTTEGTFSGAVGEVPAPGDCALLVRYATLARSTKNHPVYLFNYYHGIYLDVAGADAPSPTQRSAIGSYAGDWLTGFSDGTGDRQRCGPHGAAATAAHTGTVVTHRDFPA